MVFWLFFCFFIFFSNVFSHHSCCLLSAAALGSYLFMECVFVESTHRHRRHHPVKHRSLANPWPNLSLREKYSSLKRERQAAFRRESAHSAPSMLVSSMISTLDSLFSELPKGSPQTFTMCWVQIWNICLSSSPQTPYVKGLVLICWVWRSDHITRVLTSPVGQSFDIFKTWWWYWEVRETRRRGLMKRHWLLEVIT